MLLVKDLRQRGLLDETLVVWGGEFGRTPMNEARDGSKYLGRDHHQHAYSRSGWRGGGIKPGMSYGSTDELGYRVATDPVHVHDLNATILHQMGFDHTKLTYKFQGRNYRLTDVYGQRANKASGLDVRGSRPGLEGVRPARHIGVLLASSWMPIGRSPNLCPARRIGALLVLS